MTVERFVVASVPVGLQASGVKLFHTVVLLYSSIFIHRNFQKRRMCAKTKAAAVMANILQADIDPSGVFKYVLIRVHSKEGDESEVDVVRGYAWAEYHADVYEKVSMELEKGGLLACECVGGGRIRHEPQKKRIHVYGYSLGFGRANHAVSTEKLKARYPDYEVTWDNEGY